MAADLVESPNIQQTLEHDLESFFWVLLWIILMQVPCSWNIYTRSGFVDVTMNGQTKKTFLTADVLHAEDFEIPNNRRLRKFLTAMKTIVAARHRLGPKKPDEDSEYNHIVDAEAKTSEEDTREYSRYTRGLTFLKDHVTMFRAFEIALFGQSDSEWPTNDPAIYQGMVHSTTTDIDAVGNSGSKRSRTVAEGNGVFTEPSSSKRQCY
jgi:hypothetical protein